MSDEGYEIDADPAEFDIDDWVSGATLPSRAVKVYRSAGLRAEYDALELRFNAARLAVAGSDEDSFSDDSLAEGSPQSRLYEIALQMQQLVQQMEASALIIKIRSLSDDEMEELRRQQKTKKFDSAELGYLMLEKGAIYPRLDVSGWKKLEQAVGPKQFNPVIEAARDANGQIRGQVLPDFSLAASDYLTTRES